MLRKRSRAVGNTRSLRSRRGMDALTLDVVALTRDAFDFEILETHGLN